MLKTGTTQFQRTEPKRNTRHRERHEQRQNEEKESVSCLGNWIWGEDLLPRSLGNRGRVLVVDVHDQAKEGWPLPENWH